MVEFADGGIKAQLGTPDMKLPIQYALYYPERRNLPGDRLDFGTMGSISVQKPDMDTFLGLKLAYEAIEAGGSMPTVFNAANERAVAMFLDGKIKFLQIYDIIKSCMHFHKVTENPSLDDILEIEQWTYLMIQSQPWIWR
jgi:1-deoxy-D-xylulose-5-phosphate reductoisomerase